MYLGLCYYLVFNNAVVTSWHNLGVSNKVSSADLVIEKQYGSWS